MIGAGAGPCLGIPVLGILLTAWFCYLQYVPFVFHCPHCGKAILSDLEWRCGFCDHWNNKLKFYFSFLNTCQRCRVASTAFSCYHCNQMIALDEPADTTYFSYHLKPPTPPKPVVAAREERAEVLEKTEYEIKLTKLMTERAEALRQLRLAEEKNQPKTTLASPKTERERLEGDLARERDQTLAIDEITGRERDAARARYKDNPDLLERQLEWIERWREKHIT